MAIEDIAGFFSVAPELIRELPAIIQAAQILGYVLAILFFGSIIIKGYTGYAHVVGRFLLRLGFGFISLLSGIGISGVLPLFNTGIYRIFQVNVLAGCLISTAVLTVCVYLISHNIFNVEGIKKQVEKLQNKLKKSEELQSKGVKVRLADPVRIIGIAIAAAFVTFSMIFFSGFPDLLADMGLSKESFNELANQLESVSGRNIPADCVRITTLIQVYGSNMLSNRTTNPSAKSIIEQDSNSEVIEMYSLIHEQKEVIFGLTADNKLCSSTNNQFCECIPLRLPAQ